MRRLVGVSRASRHHPKHITRLTNEGINLDMLVARVLRAPRDLRRAVDTARRSFAVTSSEVECRNRVLRKEWEKDRIGFWEKASHHLSKCCPYAKF
eukprot:243031-Amorphochlora_amoeboformis.AAC.2